MAKIKSIIQLKEIVTPCGMTFFKAPSVKIIPDNSRAKRKTHQIIYQQNPRQYGMVGDMCDYVSDAELAELEEKGMIKIVR